MVKMGKIIGMVLLLFISSSSGGGKMEDYFPAQDKIEDWSLDGETIYYQPENLFDYINGEAELYHSYGFKELAVRMYYKKNMEESFITIDIYDMGSIENSFGTYSSYRSPGYQTAKIGGEAILAEFGLKFFQDRYFVDIYISEEDQRFTCQVAEMVSKRIGGVMEMPDVVKLLPEDGQIRNTLRYVASNILNQTFLPQGVEAHYNMEDDEVTGFVVIFEDEEDAVRGLESLRTFHIDAGHEFIETESPKDKDFVVHTRYQGILIAQHAGQYLIGGNGFKDSEAGLNLVEKIEKNLNQ